MRNEIPPGTVIETLLKVKGKSLTWLSSEAGISIDMLMQPLSLYHAALVASALGVDVPVLTSGKAEPMLTVGELAKELKVSRDTVYRKASTGVIPGFKVGGSWRFYLSEVVESARPKKEDVFEQPLRARNRRAA